MKKQLSLGGKNKFERQTTDDLNIQQDIIAEELHELKRDEVELFDDYLEMIMTYGYITLFAAAFPFGAFCTYIFLHIESRSDLFKLEKLARRPMADKCHTIGQWYLALQFLTYASIFTNITLCCFSSNQIDAIIPWLANYKDFSREAIIVVMIIEHAVLALTMFFVHKYDRDPTWLETFHHRRIHKSLKKARISHEDN